MLKLQSKWLLILAPLLLAGCVGGERAAPEIAPLVASKTSLYNRLIELSIPQEHLRFSALRTFEKKTQYVTTTQTGDGEFLLTLREDIQQTSDRPRLLGRLQRVEVSNSHKLSYTLTNRQGDVLTEGMVETPLNAKIALYPSSGGDLTVEHNIQEQIVDRVLPLIEPFIQAQPWQAYVVGHIDTGHLLVNMGPENGLRTMDTLKTVVRPLATLQVVGFEDLPNGSKRTILRLLQGTLPKVGQSLVP